MRGRPTSARTTCKAGEAAGKAAAAIRPEGGKVAVVRRNLGSRQRPRAQRGLLPGSGPPFTLAAVVRRQGRPQPAPRTTSRRPSPSTPTSASCWASGRTTPRRSPRRSRKSPEVRKRTTVVTFDLDEAAVGELEQGHIDASVCQNPYEMGFQGVRLLKALIEKDQATVEGDPPRRRDRDTGVRVIVPDKRLAGQGRQRDHIEEMKKWLASKGLKSS